MDYKTWKYLAKNLPKNVHSGSLDAEPPVKVAEVVEELLQVLRVVDLPYNLLYHAQNVHPVPAEQRMHLVNLSTELNLILQHTDYSGRVSVLLSATLNGTRDNIR